MFWPRVVAVSMSIATMLVVTACQSAKTGARAGGKSVGESPSVGVAIDPQASVKEAVLAAYYGMWQDFRRAASSADWDDPNLADHATGDAEVVLRHGLYLANQKDQVVKGAPQLHPKVTALTSASSPAKATIADCVDDTKWLIYGKDGRRAEGSGPSGRHLATANLVQRKNGWCVTSFVMREAGTC
jgi:hypothetical protein